MSQSLSRQIQAVLSQAARFVLQGCRGEASVVKQAVKAFSRHTAPEECDPLLTRFAWNLDQQGAHTLLIAALYTYY